MIRRNPGFTLVEMLVVLGIIAVLAALLLPAAMGAVTRARNAAIGMEVNQLDTAINSYKQDKGDFPPNFRRGMESVFIAHVRRCYPKIALSELNWFFTAPGGSVLTYPDGSPMFSPERAPDEGEALVFWLSHTTTDPRYPFGLTVPGNQTPNFKKYYDFDESRFVFGDAEPQRTAAENSAQTPQVVLPSYGAKYCKETCYMYIDNRFYDYFAQNYAVPPATSPFYAFAEDDSQDEFKARPYWSNTPVTNAVASLPTIKRQKPMNATTFQIICAGQDGNFGLTEEDLSTPPSGDIKLFPTGDYYSRADRDNLTNFSGGKRLEDSVK